MGQTANQVQNRCCNDGKPGFDIVISKCVPKDLEYCQTDVKIYNELNGIILQGDQYRLQDPRTSDVASLMYVNKEKTSRIMFNYQVNNRYDAGSKFPKVERPGSFKTIQTSGDQFVSWHIFYFGQQQGYTSEF